MRVPAAEPAAPAPDLSPRYAWLPQIDRATAHEILGLYNSVLRTEDIIGYPGPLGGEGARDMIQDLASGVREGRHEFLSVRSGPSLIGMALLAPNPLPNCRHRAELSKGIVLTEWRGRGIVKAALAEIARHCLRRNISILTLDVREHSRAHRLWEAVGFRPYGRLDDYARVNGVSFGGLYMYILAKRLLNPGRNALQVDDHADWE